MKSAGTLEWSGSNRALAMGDQQNEAAGNGQTMDKRAKSRELSIVLLAYIGVLLVEWGFNAYVATSQSSLAQTILAAYAYRAPNGKGGNALGLLFELPAALLGVAAGVSLRNWRPLNVMRVVFALALGNTCLDLVYLVTLPSAALWWWPTGMPGQAWHLIFSFVVSVVVCGVFTLVARRLAQRNGVSS
jgi:hypothetical protein